MSVICSFLPIIAPSGRVLILGSMPGQASLDAGQYYAHRQNAFWRIMGDLVGAEPNLPYPDRVEAIRRAGLSVWDVLATCYRDGSLDSAITDDIANDFATFFSNHPSIDHIFFNGAKAETAFRRLVAPTLVGLPLALTRLPSTSPAHAGMPFAGKLEAWRAVLLPNIERAGESNGC